MNDTTITLEPLRNALATIGLTDLLGDAYVDRRRVGVRYGEISRVAARFGLEFKHRDGNVYGALKLEPVSTTPGPVLRIVTRSDHAAVHGSKRRAA